MPGRPRSGSPPDVLSTIELPGPWQHLRVSAHGARFHVAVSGTGPLVLLLHGFPEFWWTWRHQLPALEAAGFRGAAMDLRGYGSSDKTPRGYDPVTLAGDVAAVISALGEQSAIVVGHGWGGIVAWAVATVHPRHVHGLVAVGAPHPLLMRSRQKLSARARELATLSAMQLPWIPERVLIADDAAMVERLLRRWSAPGAAFPNAEEAARYRAAMQIWPASHCALEYQRWLVRSYLRSDGRRFVGRLTQPVRCPVLQVHGLDDPAMPPDLARRSDAHVAAPFTWEPLLGAGHFPHEERPHAFNAALLGWLSRQHTAGRVGSIS